VKKRWEKDNGGKKRAKVFRRGKNKGARPRRLDIFRWGIKGWSVVEPNNLDRKTKTVKKKLMTCQTGKSVRREDSVKWLEDMTQESKDTRPSPMERGKESGEKKE